MVRHHAVDLLGHLLVITADACLHMTYLDPEFGGTERTC